VPVGPHVLFGVLCKPSRPRGRHPLARAARLAGRNRGSTSRTKSPPTRARVLRLCRREYTSTGASEMQRARKPREGAGCQLLRTVSAVAERWRRCRGRPKRPILLLGSFLNRTSLSNSRQWIHPPSAQCPDCDRPFVPVWVEKRLKHKVALGVRRSTSDQGGSRNFQDFTI